VIQSANFLLTGKKIYKPGPWDEDMCWFYGAGSMDAPSQEPQHKNTQYSKGGYYTLRNDDNYAMIRCHTFIKDRPDHSDMLHMDLWWKGTNVLRDSGTYMYNCPEKWHHYFVSTAAHNTIVVDSADQMTKVSRFMWFDWVRSRFIAQKDYQKCSAKTIQAEHYGYKRGNCDIVHRRAILTFDKAHWIIVDDILGSGKHDISLNWQLCGLEWQLAGNIATALTHHGPISIAILKENQMPRCRLLKGDDTPAGWQSLYYGSRQPAPALSCSVTAKLPLRLVTIITLGDLMDPNVSLAEDKCSWILMDSGTKKSVSLNSIDHSGQNTFVSVGSDANNIILN